MSHKYSQKENHLKKFCLTMVKMAKMAKNTPMARNLISQKTIILVTRKVMNMAIMKAGVMASTKDSTSTWKMSNGFEEVR